MTPELLPPEESVARQAVAAVLGMLERAGRTLPGRVLVDDGSGRWARIAAGLTLDERRHTVVAAATDECLVRALAHEVGGAAWLPPSTPGFEAACSAVAGDRGPRRLPLADRGVLEDLVAGAQRLHAVGWWPLWFWYRQLGPERLDEGLGELADRLQCAPVVVAGRVLLVADRERPEIEEFWLEIGAEDESRFPAAATIVDLGEALRPDSSGERTDALLRIASRGDGTVSAGPSRPVLELPTGRAVGRWSMDPNGGTVGDGWLAVPDLAVGPGQGSWLMLRQGHPTSTIIESALPDEGVPPDQGVVRLPGHVGARLRKGTPAALLVERWAVSEHRAGRPLWVPGVDADAVRLLLGLPGPIWVDGPGVPG